MFIKVTHDYDRKFGERHIINLEFQLLHFATVNLKLHHFSLEEHVLHSLAALYYKVCIYIYIYICSRYTTSTRGLSQIHEAMFDNPEGVARGII